MNNIHPLLLPTGFTHIDRLIDLDNMICISGHGVEKRMTDIFGKLHSFNTDSFVAMYMLPNTGIIRIVPWGWFINPKEYHEFNVLEESQHAELRIKYQFGIGSAILIKFLNSEDEILARQLLSKL